MWRRSISSSVCAARPDAGAGGRAAAAPATPGSEPDRDVEQGPRASTTARSITFESSRTLPGQA